jgi:translocation and assembly module TamB
MLSGFKPNRFNVRLNGEDFFIPFHPAIRARIQPDILLAGNMSAPSLTGTITIPESRLNLDRFVQQGPAEIQVKGRDTDDQGRIQMVDTAPQGAAFFKPLSADLNVVIPKNAWLKGQGLDAEIGGSINLKKEPQKSFILLGSLRTIRGNYNFQGKQFKFKKGAVSFLGLEDPNPNLDVEAAARIRKVDIIIRIGGTAREMSLSLDSDPPMDQTDIVSYIMFGKPSNALNDRDSANVEKAALGLTGQVAASELKSILGDNFFLDTITYEAGDGEENKGSVAVGKYVTPDVFVIYRQGLSAEQPNEIEASYEVNKNIKIQSNVGNEKTTGVDVFWGFDF